MEGRLGESLPQPWVRMHPESAIGSIFILLILSEPLGCPIIDDLPFFRALMSWQGEIRPPWGFGERPFSVAPLRSEICLFIYRLHS